MYGRRLLCTAAYFFALGYVAHKKQVPQEIGKIISAAVDDLNRRSARAFFDEAERHPAISLVREGRAS